MVPYNVSFSFILYFGYSLVTDLMNLPLLTPDTLTANTNSFLCCFYHATEHVKFWNPGTISMLFIWEFLISLTSKHPAGGPILASSPCFPIQYIHRSPYMDYLVLIPNYNNSCAKHLHCIKQALITQAWNRHLLTLIKCTNMRIRNSVICNHLITEPTK
jgi:hypothetical protein